jgi:hypothetical protein|tara:strand:- start:1427 stop:2032 length:606 start_codon:yes stop_codon:yes gene_type:complete
MYIKPLFVHIPKNAGTSIRKGLSVKFGKQFEHEENTFHSGHFNADIMAKRARLAGYEYDCMFAVIRHPIERFASSFAWMQYRLRLRIANKKETLNKQTKKFIESNVDDFIEFYFTRANSTWMASSYWHFLPQSDYINNKDCHVFTMDKLKVIENMLQIQIPHINKGLDTIDKKVYDMSSNSLHILQTYYERDLELWKKYSA